MRFLRERDSGRLRASLRGSLPAILTLVLFVGASLLVGRAVGAGMATAGVAAAFALLAFNCLLYTGLTAGALRLGTLLDRRPWRAYGLDVDGRWLRNVAAGAVISLVAIAVSLWYGDLRGVRAVDLGAAGISGPGGPLLPVLALVGFLVMSLFGNVFEEVLYRGIMLRNFVEGIVDRGHSLRVAAVLATLAGTVLFGLYHVPLRGNVIVAVDAAMIGVTFSLAYLLTGELGLAIGVHAGRFPLNVVQGASLGPFTVEPVMTVTDNTLGANLELKLLRLGLICLLVLGWVSLLDGELRLADGLRTD
jgi:membrane protease YdiL (CAAX protease family)